MTMLEFRNTWPINQSISQKQFTQCHNVASEAKASSIDTCYENNRQTHNQTTALEVDIISGRKDIVTHAST